MHHRLLVLLAAAAVSGGVALAQPWVPDPLVPVSSGGLEAVDRALARLSVHARLLVVGAHPDDEDNALLTWVARGMGGEAAYLSLSRGEGGQNLIGPELGVELGAIRTGELMAARRFEGGRQYFARAYDFGYTRSLEETFERWPRRVLQEDTVRIVRRFKPQVIVAVFPADERAGHGQHQASAVVAADAFEMAGDPAAFHRLPETPWSPASLYRRAWRWRGEEGTHDYSLAALDPISGRSLGQLAAASRSFHRSQDMGREQIAGPATGGLVWVAGAGGEGGGPFAGVDTRLAAIAGTMPEGPARDRVADLLDRAERVARETRSRLSPTSVGATVPSVAEIMGLLIDVRHELEDGGPGVEATLELVKEKLEIAGYGLAAAAGVVVEAVADRETVAAGGELEVEASVWTAGEARVSASSIGLLTEVGWQVEGLAVEETGDGAVERRRYRVSVPDTASPTVPYFLRRPRHGDLYDWNVGVANPGDPLEAPPLRMRFHLSIFGRSVKLIREVVYRYADQAYGERRLPVRAVPPVEVALEPDLILLGGGGDKTELAATVRSNRVEPVPVRLKLSGSGVQAAGGGTPERLFRLEGAGDSETFRFAVEPPETPGRYRVEAVTEVHWRRAESYTLRPVSYPHVRPLAVPVAATTELSRFELTLPRLERIGYVRGASDRVPEVLTALGLPVELLDGDDLERGGLAGFDAVIVGSRAYETDAPLRRANARLLEYVRGGGLLLVQYQQYQFVGGGFAPLPLEISRPHGRVTDETARVEVLEPEHAVFRHPNRITDGDWQEWVQERGLYFAGGWDEGYLPLLAIADPGREAERGGLLVAPVGEGIYVYTGLSFFRQLPAGVAGAVRLFVNLLALGER